MLALSVSFADTEAGKPLWQQGSLDNYSYVREIHSGRNMVYLARLGDLQVVVKQYSLANPKQVRAVERELRTLSKLAHPNVISVRVS